MDCAVLGTAGKYAQQMGKFITEPMIHEDSADDTKLKTTTLIKTIVVLSIVYVLFTIRIKNL